MNTYVIGCLHLMHESMAKHRGYSDSWEHDYWLIQKWNSVVPKRSKVLILGDICMENSKGYHLLDELNGSKEVVLGNHDKSKDIPELLKYVDKVSGAVDYKGYILTHIPIHPNEVQFYRGNIHAHIHHINRLEDCIVSNRYMDEGCRNTSTINKYFNVDAKLLNYKPIRFDEIYERLK